MEHGGAEEDRAMVARKMPRWVLVMGAAYGLAVFSKAIAADPEREPP